jgi:hypothetical protein
MRLTGKLRRQLREPCSCIDALSCLSHDCIEVLQNASKGLTKCLLAQLAPLFSLVAPEKPSVSFAPLDLSRSLAVVYGTDVQKPI